MWAEWQSTRQILRESQAKKVRAQQHWPGFICRDLLHRMNVNCVFVSLRRNIQRETKGNCFHYQWVDKVRVTVKRLTSALIHPTAAEWDHLPPQSLSRLSENTMDFNRRVASKRGSKRTQKHTHTHPWAWIFFFVRSNAGCNQYTCHTNLFSATGGFFFLPIQMTLSVSLIPSNYVELINNVNIEYLYAFWIHHSLQAYTSLSPADWGVMILN